MHRPITKTKIIELSRKYDIPTNRIEEIIKSQFELVDQTIRQIDPEKEYYPSVQLLKLGKFWVTPMRVGGFKKLKQRKNNEKV